MLRRALPHAGLVAVSLLVAAVLMEGALRALYPKPIRWTFPQEYYDFDPEVAHVLRPGQRAYTHDKPVSVNSLGLRDRDYPPHPPPGVRRAVAIGDSQTFGNGLALEDTWPKQLERRLEETSGGVRWELLNGGIPGTDTWQHERLLRRLLDAYQPHAAVLAFYVNDVAARYEPRERRVAGKTNTGVQRLAYLLKRSALVSILQQRLQALEHAGEIERGHAFGQYIVTGRPHDRVERGWAQVEQSLAAMKVLCDARGVAFLVAVLPRRDQVAGAEPSRAYNERIAGILARLGIPALDLLGDLEHAYADHGADLFIPWDGHNSALANAVIAQRIAERLESLGSLVATQ